MEFDKETQAMTRQGHQDVVKMGEDDQLVIRRAHTCGGVCIEIFW